MGICDFGTKGLGLGLDNKKPCWDPELIQDKVFLFDKFIVKPKSQTLCPNTLGPAQSNPGPKAQISSKGTGADTKILWATHPTPPHHPQLLSMKEASNKKTQRVKVTKDDILYLFS